VYHDPRPPSPPGARTTTTADATATRAIVALDLGKYKSVACVYTGDPAGARYDTLTTDRDHLRRLFARHRPAVVVSEAWKFKHAKPKTDRDDALRLAQLEALGQLPVVALPPQQTREWRALIACRQVLVGRRRACLNRVRALLVGQGLPAPRGHRAWTATGLEGIARHAKPLADCGADELWRGLRGLALAEYRQARELIEQAEARLDALARADEGVRLLEGVPGVGTRTAAVIVAHRHQPGRFATGKQVSASAGLVPRPFQSGETDRRGRITRRGPALLRQLLVECAWAMRRYNRWAAALYARLSRGRARKKQAVVALARRLLVRCWAMMRDGADWRDGPTPAAAGG
jgi:transposase